MNISNHIHAQNYFSKVDICDTCTYSNYRQGVFKNNTLEIIGIQYKYPVHDLFVIQLNLKNIIFEKKIIQKGYGFYNLLFGKLGSKNFIIYDSAYYDSTIMELMDVSFLNKYDSNYNLLQKTIIDIEIQNKKNYFRNLEIIDNKICLFGQITDSISTYLSQNPGYIVYDTNGVLLDKKSFPIPHLGNIGFSNVEFINNTYYLMGNFHKYANTPSVCLSYESGFIIALDSNRSFLWQKILSPNASQGIMDVVKIDTNLLLNTYMSPKCTYPSNFDINKNIQCNMNGDSIISNAHEIFIMDNVPLKSYNLDKNKFVLFSNRSGQGSADEFVYQVCNQEGQFLTEILHLVPLDCISRDQRNTTQSIIQDPNTKNLVMLGSVAYHNTQTSTTTQQPWIIFSDSVGCITPNCHQKITGISNIESVTPNIYPNPSNGIFNISIPIKMWQVFNMQGQLITTGKTSTINLKSNNDGMYLLKIVADNNVTSIIKIIKE
jgi:Secretion system C-terminal sorting domain